MAKELLKETALENAVKSVMDKLSTARGGAEIKAKTIGGNGREPGAKVTFTGKVDIVERDINGKKVSYYAAETTTSEWISVQSLMGVSSMKGYNTTGIYPHEFDNESGEKESRDVEATAKDLNFSSVFNPSVRELYTLIAHLQASEILKGKSAFYRGQIVRDYEAKKDVTSEVESWKKGYKRTMTAQMWQILNVSNIIEEWYK
jgi:hypothetical protein